VRGSECGTSSCMSEADWELSEFELVELRERCCECGGLGLERNWRAGTGWLVIGLGRRGWHVVLVRRLFRDRDRG
jgi:hypothetical protein